MFSVKRAMVLKHPKNDFVRSLLCHTRIFVHPECEVEGLFQGLSHVCHDSLVGAVLVPFRSALALKHYVGTPTEHDRGELSPLHVILPVQAVSKNPDLILDLGKIFPSHVFCQKH